ncbi:flagellin [Microvirga lupini]|uniref:Flagellin n=1 Tax=Microvirga lupini TaxID=420324 RepID=A0A7W4YVL7_9HYPH|nr:flagellin [Microvirga lupini]MBB3017329.1 flagellin [Microvirga lupini]
MSSINTNLSAMTALQSLKTTQNSMNKTQGQISTGLRVGEASHNASYWSISTKMKSDNGALGAVKDAIGQSKSMIDTFTSALDKTLVYLNKMKDGLVSASQPGADKVAIQTEFDGHIEGLESTARSATFNGQNWLAGETPGTISLVTSYNGSTKEVGFLEITGSDLQLLELDADGVLVDDAGILNGAAADADPDAFDPASPGSVMKLDIETASAAELAVALKTIDTAIDKVTKASSILGANKALLETQEEFISVLSDSLTAGVSTFIDADMNEASTRYQALQTQQQLGVQALSMANQNSQMILKLFQ